MITFTATILGLVFGYNFIALEYAYEGLCSASNNESHTGTNTAKYYYVDYPAARCDADTALTV